MHKILKTLVMHFGVEWNKKSKRIPRNLVKGNTSVVEKTSYKVLNFFSYDNRFSQKNPNKDLFRNELLAYSEGSAL